jgi:predicted signal transduction protein with EAL and GGDEF domain
MRQPVSRICRHTVAREAHAVVLAKRLLDRLAEPITIGGRELALGASVGIVIHEGGPGDSEELVRQAGVAMYAAKAAGRGRYELFGQDMAREFSELLGLEHELRLGLQRGEFAVHYQPEIDLATGSIVGVEALLRWNSPGRGPRTDALVAHGRWAAGRNGVTLSAPPSERAPPRTTRSSRRS